jgi:hypothetical protein
VPAVLVCLIASLAGGALLLSGTVSGASIQTMTALRRQMHDGPVCEDTFDEAWLPEARQLFVVHTSSDAQMAQDFTLFLQHNGFEAEIYDELFVMVRYNGEHFLMDVRASRGELGRVIVAKVFDIARDYRHTLEMTAYVLRLNKTFDFANFSLSEKSDRLIIQGNITFVDHIDEQEIRKFLDFFYRGIARVFDLLPETAQYLR